MSDADDPDASARLPRAWMDVVRFIVAAVMTLVVLPFGWGYSAIMTMLVGRPNLRILALWLVSGVAVAVLVRGLGRRPPLAPYRGALAVWMLFGWIVTGAVISVVWMSALTDRLVFVPFFIAASLWVHWATWMYFSPLRPAVRFGVLALLLFPAGAFFGLTRIEGMEGDSRLVMTLRTAAPRHGADFDAPPAAGGTANLSSTGERDYPEFMGRRRDAAIDGVELARDGKARRPKLLWRRNVGAGWGAFSIVGDYAVTQEQRGDKECTVCYALKTGEEIWSQGHAARLEGPGGPGPRATPTISGGRVHVLGGAGLLECLDGKDGRVLWSTDILADAGADNLIHGMCGSPLVVGDSVVVCPSGGPGNSLVGYDKATGRKLWQGGVAQASYSSPMLAELAGVPQILVFDADGLGAYEPTNGRTLWSFAWCNVEHIAGSQPVVLSDERILLATGYGRGAVLLKVRRNGSDWKIEPLWTSRDMKSKFSTALAIGDFAYGLDDGILACIDLSTGRKTWKKARYGHGQLLRVGDRIVAQTEPGEVALFEPDPKTFKELARLPALDSKAWNNPAFAPPYLLVRNDREAICFELPLESAAPRAAEPDLERRASPDPSGKKVSVPAGGR